MNAYQIPADPTAVIGRRIVAYIIDAILGVVVFAVLLLALGDSQSFPSSDFASDACEITREVGDDPVICFNLNEDAWAAEGSDSLAISGLSFVFAIVNHIVLPGMVGGSIGKLALGLRVVKRETGRIAGIGPNIVRTLLWIVDAFPYCFPLVGLITGLTTKGHRRVGDMAAGTLVVDKGAVGTPPLVPGLVGAGAAAYAGAPGPGGWTPPQGSPQGWDAPPPPPPAPGWGAPPPPAGTPAPPDAWTPPAPSAPAPPADPWATPAPSTPSAPEFEPPAPPQPAEAGAATADPWSPSEWTPPTPVASEVQAPEPQLEPESAPEPEPEYEPVTAAYEPATATYESAPEPEPVPEPEPEREPEPEATGADQPGVGAPMWDAARNAYIQWDPALGSWMQWDDTAGQWRPIS